MLFDNINITAKEKKFKVIQRKNVNLELLRYVLEKYSLQVKAIIFALLGTFAIQHEDFFFATRVAKYMRKKAFALTFTRITRNTT